MILKGKLDAKQKSTTLNNGKSGKGAKVVTVDYNKNNKARWFVVTSTKARKYTIFLNETSGGALVGMAMYPSYALSIVWSKDGRVTLRFRAFARKKRK